MSTSPLRGPGLALCCRTNGGVRITAGEGRTLWRRRHRSPSSGWYGWRRAGRQLRAAGKPTVLVAVTGLLPGRCPRIGAVRRILAQAVSAGSDPRPFRSFSPSRPIINLNTAGEIGVTIPHHVAGERTESSIEGVARGDCRTTAYSRHCWTAPPMVTLGRQESYGTDGRPPFAPQPKASNPWRRRVMRYRSTPPGNRSP
jgi:hypothetical protein